MRIFKKSCTSYSGKNLDYIAFPMGGIGAGMICIEGNGSFSHISLKHKPDFKKYAFMFATFAVKGKIPRVLEGPVPEWKIFSTSETGRGLWVTNFGLPRCQIKNFTFQFPFAFIKLIHPDLPLKIDICGWSPFIPGDPDNSSLPVAAIEYTFKNTSSKSIKGVFSFHSKNFMAAKAMALENGFVLFQEKTESEPHKESHFTVQILNEKVTTSFWCGRGIFFDTHSIILKDILATKTIENKIDQDTVPGASIFKEIVLEPHKSKTMTVLISWYVPYSDLKIGDSDSDFYQPWYAEKFKSIKEVSDYWQKNYEDLKEKTALFTRSFYASSIPHEIKDAIGSNLSIFKSPTMMRQKDGRLWCWEGCLDDTGCCPGSCTHVWNYCQAIAHLFPSLERSLRETEFNENQDENGHQNFRALLPIRPNTHDFHAAADGQLGGIMKIYREWRISGDTQWLKKLWPKVKKSLEYCIKTWDPEHNGYLKFPHHNTYDIEFWGPDGMCCSFYCGALKAAMLIAEQLNEDSSFYRELYLKSKKYLEEVLFNGEYFEQKIMWKYPEMQKEFEEEKLKEKYKSARIVELVKKEGPPYQYGNGCLADGVLGAWIAEMCGLGEIIDKNKIKKHLLSVYKYNFKKDLSNHINLQRPSYAMGKDGGLILCTWPKGNRPTMPFPYCDEVWTGFEYQVASHLIINGFLKEGLEIVKTARKRHDGTKRNPFDEYECGHWYGRALSCWGLIQAFTGLRYDAVTKTLYLKKGKKKDFSVFFSTEKGWGIAGIKKGKPFIRVLQGNVPVEKIEILD
ncbi:MAG: non-lysosomal glucosylceramidase [Candidatus Omnitrophica bacterium]|nr:non-lysosomal glucosylceramidase [Candidatus Omnitrophota bacterium]